MEKQPHLGRFIAMLLERKGMSMKTLSEKMELLEREVEVLRSVIKK